MLQFPIIEITTEFINWEELEKFIIKPNQEIPPLAPVIHFSTGIFAAKNFISVLAGKTGAGKTTYLSMILAQAFMPEKPEEFDGLGFQVAYANDKKVIYFSFEEGLNGIERVRNNFKKFSGLANCPENLILIDLMHVPRDKRFLYFQSYLNAFSGQIHFVAIDGLQYLIHDMNDLGASNKLIDFLKSAANYQNTSFVVCSHENFGNNKIRGHLGSELEHASMATLSANIDKKNALYSLEDKKFRFSPILQEPLLYKYCTDSQRMVTLSGQEAQAAAAKINKAKKREEDLIFVFKTSNPAQQNLQKSAWKNRLLTYDTLGARKAGTKPTANNWFNEAIKMGIIQETEPGSGLYNLSQEILTKTPENGA